MPGDTGGPPKRARPSSASTESHEGTLRLEACRKAGFLKQEPADEFSELFGLHQQGLPPPYPLSQLPPGPGLGGLGPQPWFLYAVTPAPPALSRADPCLTEGAEVQRG